MSTLIQKHLSSGEIRFSQELGYHCNICEVPLGAQPLQHLNGNQHKNKAFFIALRHPVEFPALHNDLPVIVREAANDNIIEVSDLEIKCHSCGIALSGEKPLVDHLKSSGHRKKTEMKKLTCDFENLRTDTAGEGASSNPFQNARREEISHPIPPNIKFAIVPSERYPTHETGIKRQESNNVLANKTVPISGINRENVDTTRVWGGPVTREQPPVRPREEAAAQVLWTNPGITQEVPWTNPGIMQDDSVEEKAIQAEVAAGHIEDLGGVYRCKVCLMSLTGREPVLQHINGRKHRTKTQTGIPKAGPIMAVQQPQNNEAIQDDLFSSSKHRIKTAGRNAEPRNTENNLGQRTEAFLNYMSSPSYSTVPSQVNVAPMNVTQIQHGNQYLFLPSKDPLFDPYRLPNTDPPHDPYRLPNTDPQHDPYRLPNTDPQHDPYRTAVSYPEQRAGHTSSYEPFNMETAQSLPTFLVKKTGAFWHRPPTAYKLLTRPRGYVAVFNNHFDNDPDWKRDGSLFDDENLKSVFEQMEYRIQLFPNRNKSQVFDHVDHILRNIIGVDSLILFFLSHGKDERRFYSADRKLIDIRDIWTKLTDQNCPALKNKPKILFLNYCRGETKQANRFFDNFSEKEEYAPRDVAIIHASLPGFKAQRLPTEGTIFIHSLCQVLCESVCEKDIHEIINDTTELMQQKGGTTPSIEFIRFQKFYFID